MAFCIFIVNNEEGHAAGVTFFASKIVWFNLSKFFSQLPVPHRTHLKSTRFVTEAKEYITSRIDEFSTFGLFSADLLFPSQRAETLLSFS